MLKPGREYDLLNSHNQMDRQMDRQKDRHNDTLNQS